MRLKKIEGQFFKRRDIIDTYLHVNSITKVFTCPSCAFPTISEKSAHEICFICNWEDDGQNDEDSDKALGGPNDKLSLTDSRVKIIEDLNRIENDLHLKVIEDPERILGKIKLLSSDLESYKLDRNKLLSFLME